MIEEWRTVKDYESEYMVSNLGNIKRIFKNPYKSRILSPCVDKDGYLRVTLCKNNKTNNVSVHRVVATAFVDNPNDYPCVNHKDEDKTNNRADNLEWCTIAYNNAYGSRTKRSAEKRRIKLVAVKDGVAYGFESIMEASKCLGVEHGNISSCIHNAYGRKTLKGYSFMEVKEWIQ